MRILFVSAVLPYPLHSGGQVRIYNLLKRVSRRHSVTLLSFIRNQEERALLKQLSFCANVRAVYRGRAWSFRYVARAIFGRYPFLWETYNNVSMRQMIADELKTGTYDLVHIEPGYVYPSVPDVPIPLVVSEHNIEHAIYASYVSHFFLSLLRPILGIDVAKMASWEKVSWHNASRILAVSDEDAAHIQQYVQPDIVSVVPNGVDTTVFSFKPKKIFDTKHLKFLFVGNFAWMQNTDAMEFLVRDLWPGIVSKYPGASLTVVGRQLPDRLRGRMDRSSVVYKEYVDRIQDEMNLSDIMLAPIRIGGGTKYKILESMATGLPVLSTTVGVRGIHGSPGREFCVGDTLDDMVRCIETLSHSGYRGAMIKLARKRIEEEYSWDMIAQTLLGAWEGIHEKNN